MSYPTPCPTKTAPVSPNIDFVEYYIRMFTYVKFSLFASHIAILREIPDVV